MPNSAPDLLQSIFTKTETGQDEILTRAKKLTPMFRRLLILVDGRKSGHDLAGYVPGLDAIAMLSDLLAQDCIAITKTAPALSANVPRAPGVGETDPALTMIAETLPPSATRTPKELEMARNFMTNTINATFGQHMCLSLIEAISLCTTTEALRLQYPAWIKTMASNRNSAKELPGLNDKLRRVL